MDLRRGQLSRDAVASSSGHYVAHRCHPVRLPSRCQWVQHLPRLSSGHRDVATTFPAVACRALRGAAQPLPSPSGRRPVTAAASTSADTVQAVEQPQALVPSSQQQQQQQQHEDAAGGGAAWRSSAERVRRLNTLVETRRLYRNCIRAEYLLALPSPLYTPPPPPPAAAVDPQAEALATAVGSSGLGGGGGGSDDVDADRAGGVSSGLGGSLSSLSGQPWGSEEDKALKAALDTTAEMMLVMEQLKASQRSLPAGFGSVIFPPGSAAANEEAVWEAARQHVAGLRERLAAELPQLPISGDVALHYIESRNAKYSRRVALDERQGGGGAGAGGGGGGSSAGASSGAGGGGGPGADGGGGGTGRTSALERLEAAERVAGEIIANSIKPALKKASEQDLLEVVRGTGSYLRGLWVRLNGGQPGAGRWGPGLGALAGRDLPRPEGTQEQSELAISRLSLDLEGLEKRLQEASKRRENKLRKAGLQGRVQMAIQLKGLDAEVLQLSSLLAVRTLQLEMEYVYGSLEAEALDVFNGVQAGGLLARDGSTNELALLVAEFALLGDQLTIMAAALEGGAAAAAASAGGAGAPAEAGAAGAGAAPAAAAGHSAIASSAAGGAAGAAVAAAAAAMGPALINDEVLSKLAVEIPDMRSRVGVADQVVFGGPGFSLTKARLQIRESLDKVREAVTFLTRGFKLLGSDVATGARLFLKAALGNTLKPREVSALRRTARDLLTFIPFTIILIVPLSPLGHVLVFGFIQRYFPSFFPSQFSTRRQDIMVRYEELERQLLEAQAAAEAAEEEVELARAREAVARLMAPEQVAAAAPVAVTEAAVQVGGGDGAGPTAPPAAEEEAEGGGPGGAAGAVAGSAAAAAVKGAAAAGANGGAVSGGGGTPLGGGSAVSSVDEVTLHEATKKVRILAEQLDEIRDDVHMGDPLSDGDAGGGGGVLSKASHGGRH